MDNFLANAAALATVLTLLCAVLWWLVKPRVDAFAASLRAGQAVQLEQLSDDATPGTLAHSAKAAATAAAAIPELRRQVESLLALARRWDELAERVDRIDVLQDNLHARLGSVEQALIAYLGGSLHEAYAETRSHEGHAAQRRADAIRDRRQGK